MTDELQAKGVSALLDELRKQVRLVARLRAEQDQVDQQVADLRSAFEARYASEIESLRRARQTLTEAEAALRYMAVLAFKETGDKKPVTGVAVQMRARMEYSPEAAIEWAIAKNRRSLLTLKRSDFERVAKALEGAGPEDALWFVQRVQEPAATISTDLTAFVEEPADRPDLLEIPF